MINTRLSSSISLIFNESWLSHIGSRIYQMAIETIELLGTAFSYPLVQAYSGKRLYQLVDTYRESKNNKEGYDQARFSYADCIIKALKDEKNIFEKTKRVRTILNTHIIGLSILQGKDKQALSEHVAYTLLPSLIKDFGEQMANRSLLALQELDNGQSKSVNEYAKLYRDITLQQNDLDSFVKALQELNRNVDKDIFIHELILSRNRSLTDPAKNKILSILKDSHYINIKVQRKLQLLKQLKNQNELNKSEITLEFKSHRDAQVEAIHYNIPSMFFGSITTLDKKSDSLEMDSQSVKEILSSATPIVSKNRNQDCWYNAAIEMSNTPIYKDSLERDQFFKDFPTISESLDLDRKKRAEQLNLDKDNPLRKVNSARQSENLDRKESLASAIPIGIQNTNLNCWYSAALQVMLHTPISKDILQKKGKLSKYFPKIATSLHLYRHTQANKLTLSVNLIQKIRAEIHNLLDKTFNQKETKQEDSIQFLDTLLTKLSIDFSRVPFSAIEDIYSLNNKYIFIEKHSSQRIDLSIIPNKYKIYGFIFHSGVDGNGHYIAVVKIDNSWYLCDDDTVEKISEKTIESKLKTDTALIMISHQDDLAVPASDPGS